MTTKNFIAYGFINTNRRYDNQEIKNTLAYKQLKEFNPDSIVIDAYWHSEKRPNLEHLIQTVDSNSVICLYSIDTLLKGKNQGVYYYEQILEKGIPLLVLDHDGDLLKLSPVSTFRFGQTEENKLTEREKLEFVQIMKNIASEHKPLSMIGKAPVKAEFSKEFRELYFLYEAYLITEKMLMQHLPERLNILNKQTFISLCREYEKSLLFKHDFAEYCKSDSKFLKLPKRTGKLPREYEDIIMLAKKQHGEKKDCIQKALDSMGILCDAGVIIRWKLAQARVPKPRKPDGRKVKINFKSYPLHQLI
jgi:hypothetical protein